VFLLGEEGGDRLPEIGPGVEDRCLLDGHAHQAGEEAAALIVGRLPLGNPVGGRDAALGRPMAQECGFANAATTIEQHHLAWPRARAGEELREEGQFTDAVDKHSVPTIDEYPSRLL